MEEALVNLLKVTMSEIFDSDLVLRTPEEVVARICSNAELALSPSGERELINHLNKFLN